MAHRAERMGQSVERMAHGAMSKEFSVQSIVAKQLKSGL